MEPYKPEFRNALKAAHPGLKDDVIDRLESLTAKRAMARPEHSSTRELRSLDAEIEDILRVHMPRFQEVARVQAAMARNTTKKATEISLRLKESNSTHTHDDQAS